MEVNPGALPRPGRVPAQEFWSPEACWRWRRRSKSLLEKGVAESGFLRRGVNIGRRGAPGVAPSTQVASWRGLGWGRAPWPPGRGVAPLQLSFGLREASVALIFFIFFLEFFGHCKYG